MTRGSTITSHTSQPKSVIATPHCSPSTKVCRDASFSRRTRRVVRATCRLPSQNAAANATSSRSESASTSAARTKGRASSSARAASHTGGLISLSCFLHTLTKPV